jgi:ankyrin repeat protein
MTRWLNGLSVLGVSGLLLVGGCRDRQKVAADELSEAGYQLTEADWFRAAASDDAAILARFTKGGYAVELRNPEGDTALHVAAAVGAEKSAKWLLDQKLPVDVRGSSERTPLMSAVIAGKPVMVRWLLRQDADPRAKDADGYKPLMLAVREGHGEVVGELAAHDRDDLDNALLMAALLGQTQVIDALTNYGASVYARMDDGRTPLMLAAERGHQDAAKLLVDLGANRFTSHQDGRIAADMAEAGGHAELAAMLRVEPALEEFSLQAGHQVGEEMAVARDSGTEPGPLGQAAHTSEPVPETARRKSPALIAGQVLGVVSSSTDGPTRTLIDRELPLVMRQFRHRELPLEIRRVDGTIARVALKSGRGSELKVKEGETIPGTRLRIIRAQRRMESGKENFGRPMEVSVVEVEDLASGQRRRLVAGVAATAHDPMALVEDTASGARYVAAPGHSFTTADGTRYTISDVRPNQLVIEEVASGRVRTLPLRGPRG